MTSDSSDAEMNLRVARVGEIITISHPTQDRHVDIEARPEIDAMSPEDFEARVIAPARNALGIE